MASSTADAPQATARRDDALSDDSEVLAAIGGSGDVSDEFGMNAGMPHVPLCGHGSPG